ncbi:MAG: tripartite tricarboxylate transporter substrate binding protein [Rhodoferax sp.]
MHTRFIASMAIAASLAATPAAHADTWPTKPLRLVFPSAPGGGPERVIRALSTGLGQRLGQPVVMDYKSGAGGNIGAADIAKSAPDGYSWMLASESTLTINPHVYKSLGFKVEDLVPIKLIASLPQVLVCNPAVGARTVPELIQRARDKPLTYASPAAGSGGHLTMEMFLDATKVKMTHVPYRGVAPAVTDLLGGQVDCYFGVVSAFNEFIKTKRLVPIAVSTARRVSILPDVPTVREQGYADFDATFYLGIFAPRNVPQDIRARFTKALDETVRSAEVVEAMAANALTPVDIGAEAAEKELRDISSRWAGIAKRINLTID